MKEIERMNEMIKKCYEPRNTPNTRKGVLAFKGILSCVSCISWLTLSTPCFAATGESAEFRVDLAGMGPWEARTAQATEAISYSSAWATNAMSGAKAVVKVCPVKKEKPKYIAIDLSGGIAAAKYPIEYLDDVPAGGWSDEYKTSKLVLRHIPVGSFIMGGRATDYPGAVNTNLHMVTLTKDFYMGVFEVTQRQWELVMGDRPSRFTNETCYATRPVEYIQWIDIRGAVNGITFPKTTLVDEDSFIGRVRARSRVSAFDLPSEAQMEYACRAGTQTGLNSGDNCSDVSNVVELAGLARYASNSGWQENGNKWTDEYFANATTERGTAKVGSYKPNDWGLYDMHGNVWEYCLDLEKTNEVSLAAIDPVGAEYGTTDRRVYKGGSWRHYAEGCVSGHRDGPRYTYIQALSKGFNVGFRLCLQGGELPEETAGMVLVNTSGADNVNWAPTKAGTYYLTHETQTNGVNGAEVLGAWFTVAGPELQIEAQGELTNGVMVAINGAGEGWTVRYDVGGATEASRPVGEWTEYTGPFVLDESATIRAVAFSEGGVESEEAVEELTLHPAPAITGITARQRYPWNGKVDVGFTLSGDPSAAYLTSLAVKDIAGGTNLPLKTAWRQGGGATNTVFTLSPGSHRLVWDANADIVSDAEFPEVAVSVKATGSALLNKEKAVALTVAGYTGTETLTDVPVLVRISESIDGFAYADCSTNSLVFMDEDAKVTLPYEIDEWHEDGESLVWVKLPELKQGAQFTMAYGGAEAKASPHEVWREYAGVWHMNEDAGTAYDSTANGLDALPSCGTNELADISQMVAYENGACGRARVNATAEIQYGNYLTVPGYDGLSLGSSFSIGGWFNVTCVNKTPRIFSRKESYKSTDGWETHFNTSAMSNTVRGASNSLVLRPGNPDAEGKWVNFAYVFANDVVTLYTNGVTAVSGAITPATDNGKPLSFGCNSNGTEWSLNGRYDEIRLRDGSLTADRIKADYDMIANRDWLTYGKAEDVEAKVGSEE